ncbi:hypothetical protein PanWU01x14_352660 [Parasponia andersonii]|uniref:Uncharacterized protein n=1 Tax=Parasponia andersonii TaxID=3476 RepID=A0A2P5AA77_PARAD|nr:hypothetical protein PanWU01x14_352660 [Parasponia andersonii]
MDVSVGGGSEAEKLLGVMEPWLDHHHGVKDPPLSGLRHGQDLQVVLDPRDHLLLRLHHLREPQIAGAGVVPGAAATADLAPVVLLDREPAELLNLLVRLHVLDRGPPTDQRAAVRRREEEAEDDGERHRR